VKSALKHRTVLLIVSAVILLGAAQLTSYEIELWNSPEAIIIAAASDLKFAFEELGAAFEAETGTQIIFKFGSSGLLASEIEGGAPYDVYASANKEFVTRLVEEERLIEDTARLYANGRIVLVSRTDGDFIPVKPEDLTDSRIRIVAIANPAHAPYGVAAKEALENSGVWLGVQDNLVYGKNILDTLELVQMGEADAGIVAYSLIPENKDLSSDLTFTPIDDDSYTFLEQTIGVVSYSHKQESAVAFIGFATSAEGRSILEKHGFIVPDEIESRLK